VLRGFEEKNNKKKEMFVLSLNQLNKIDNVSYIDYRNITNIFYK